jgi:hypothetical protein
LSNSKLVNFRPYKYYYFQKIEIKKIIEELLYKSFIQPLSDLFDSLVFLVKKNDNS